MLQIVMTSDGSQTLFIPAMDEHYHSVNGAVQESEFIFVNAGFNFSKADPLFLFEVGFGTGLNVLLTAVMNLGSKREVYYTSIEKFPLPDDIIRSLNYGDIVPKDGKLIFDRIHSCQWNMPCEISEKFTLNKISGDLLTQNITGKYNLIYFDAFGPDKQPEMWSDEVFEKIAGHTLNNGVLVTYSAKGEVKRRLRKYGFEVTLLPGPPGKRQIIRAIKV